MTLVLGFSLALLLAVLVSAYAQRSVLSTAVLFLAAGFIGGVFGLGNVENEGIRLVSELALFSVLFTDGMRTGVRDLVQAWRLPGRALLFGLPLTLLGTAVLAHYIAGLPWPESFLLGAVLSPTDPVFAAAIVGREEVPLRLRRLLNIESGLNDGLVLPVIVVLVALVGAETEVAPAFIELGEGIALGVAIPFVAIALERTRFFAASPIYEPLNGFAIGLLTYAAASVTHGNIFLAAFAAGVTLASRAPATRDNFHRFGELLSELLKLAALFVFGTLISPAFLSEIGWTGYLFAILALVAVRPIALSVALVGGGLDRIELAAAAWFGPKGFASVVYGLFLLTTPFPLVDAVFHLVAIVTAASMIAHSSTDVLVARLFRGESRESLET